MVEYSTCMHKLNLRLPHFAYFQERARTSLDLARSHKYSQVRAWNSWGSSKVLQERPWSSQGLSSTHKELARTRKGIQRTRKYAQGLASKRKELKRTFVRQFAKNPSIEIVVIKYFTWGALNKYQAEHSI